uniref:Uncharacterized protein n=1 Tax=viral metagenome TaxID=1070528 RepID=A0A6C0LV40_9ZZZZ
MPYLTLTELSSKHTTNRNIIHKSVNQAAFGIEGTNHIGSTLAYGNDSRPRYDYNYIKRDTLSYVKK